MVRAPGGDRGDPRSRRLRHRSIWHPAVGTFVVGYPVSVALTIAWAAASDWQIVEFSDAGLIR